MDPMDNPVAVVGLALRVPGASSPEELWANLKAGRVTLPTACGADGLFAGRVEREAAFDRDLFGFTPLQARVADPQHRALLELSWLALEDADSTEIGEQLVGVYVGCGPPAYSRDVIATDPGVARSAGAQQISLLNDRDFLASSLSYRLGLSGPSLTVQTACSTSLVAVHLAARALLTHEIDLGLAGAATIHVPPADYTFREGDVVAPDGVCRPFTTGANGTVPSSGAVVVVLKRLGDAIADGDRVRAVLLGSAINNDGPHRMSEAAPSPEGHEAVIREALAIAGLEAEDIDLVQTHGTGTSLGDQVELSVLRATYGSARSRPALLGAVKANIGHTDTAAGAIGLAATVLALEHRLVPPVPHQYGDRADLEIGAGLMLPRDLVDLSAHDGGLRAAVSSLGLGGSNAHVVLGSAPSLPPPEAQVDDVRPLTIAVSAASEAALSARLEQLTSISDPVALAGVSSTWWHRHRHLDHRRAFVLSRSEPDGILAQLRAKCDAAAGAPGGPRRVAFVFPGQGEGVVPSGVVLAGGDPAFAARWAEMIALVRDVGGPDLAAPSAVPTPTIETAVVQPWLFALELGLALRMREVGFEADAMVGHSVGEIVAATLAGVFSVEDGARLVVERGRLMGAAAPGSMMATSLDEHTALLVAQAAGVDVAAINDTTSVVLSGPADRLDDAARLVAEHQGRTVSLATSHAFHSRLMHDAAQRFTDVVAGVSRHAPSVPVWSNVTGRPLSQAQAQDPQYWADHIRQPVRFLQNLEGVFADGPALVVTVGPSSSIQSTIRRIARRSEHRSETVACLGPDADNEQQDFTVALARGWESGRRVRLPIPAPAAATRVPPYPLSEERYWATDAVAHAEPDEQAAARSGASGSVNLSPESYDEPQADGRESTAETLSRIWAASFGVATVAIDDNFFELGGSSLQAAQLMSEIAEALIIDVGLSDLYEHATLSDFAVRVDALLEERDNSPEFLELLREVGGSLD